MKLIYAIDDEPTTLRWLRNQFNGDDCHVRTFHSLDQLQNAIAEETPDLLITDVIMPDNSGYEVVRQIREKSQDLKIIMMSALEGDDFARIAESYHCGWWSKSPDVNQLKILVSEALRCH